MSDYEATAYLSLEKLKEKHQLEIQQLHERLRAEASQKTTHSRKLMENKDNNKLSCTFCGKGQEEVRKLIAGPSVYICDECVDLCNDIIEVRQR